MRQGIYGQGEPPDTYTEEPLTPGIVQTEELRSPRPEPEENRRHGNVLAHVQALTERLETLEATLGRIVSDRSVS